MSRWKDGATCALVVIGGSAFVFALFFGPFMLAGMTPMDVVAPALGHPPG